MTLWKAGDGLNIIIAIVIFSVIIIFHELGHFLLAKKNGIRVNEFCLGLGPSIIGFTKGETRYALRLLPFGGACMMEGEDGESTDSRAFQNKSVLARISVVAAGPIFNFIMAFVFSMIIIGYVGYDKPVIAGIMDGYPAQEAGLQKGDVIQKLNGKKIHFAREINSYLFFNAGKKLNVTYKRDGKINQVTVTPKYDKEQSSYLIGFYQSSERTKTNPIQTVQYGAYYVKYYIDTTVDSLKMLVTGKAGIKDMSGPVGLVKVIGDTYHASESEGVMLVIMNMLNISVLISVNLGVMNLLPIPALDGGRLVFLIIELIRRKKVDQEKEGMVHLVGMSLLMLLMVFVMYQDVHKIFFK